MRALACALAFAALACDDGLAARGRLPGDPGPGARVDAGAPDDAGALLDAGGSRDAKLLDADAPDAAVLHFDARASDDAARPIDATPPAGDATPLAFDAAPSFPDAAPSFPDAAPSFPDATPPPGSGEVWIELDYSSAPTPRSPNFRYSSTPGWGERQWAAVNASWPEAWDRFNNMQVVDDPIGRALEIGSGSELQLMIGLEELIAYDWAEIHIEGRSRATSSPVSFDVYNPWTGCGASGSFGQQWTVQAQDLDLSQCYEIGQGVQAVRVDPTNGTIALVRLRLTLHGAVY